MKKTLLALALALALVLTVAACGGSDNGNAPADGGQTSAPAGGVDAAALFADNCAGCHGEDGSGGFGPDLREEDNVEGVAERIRQGGDKMPAFGDKLSDDEIQALAEYVTSQI